MTDMNKNLLQQITNGKLLLKEQQKEFLAENKELSGEIRKLNDKLGKLIQLLEKQQRKAIGLETIQEEAPLKLTNKSITKKPRTEAPKNAIKLQREEFPSLPPKKGKPLPSGKRAPP